MMAPHKIVARDGTFIKRDLAIDKNYSSNISMNMFFITFTKKYTGRSYEALRQIEPYTFIPRLQPNQPDVTRGFKKGRE